MFCQGKLIKIFTFFTVILVFSCAKNNARWSYQGKNGPQFWGNITENYKFCKIGYNQSPINIALPFDNNNLNFLYQEAEIDKKIMPNQLYLTVYGENFVVNAINQKKYHLQYIKFHHLSEHQVNGKAYDLEMQLVHKSEDEQWLIASFFIAKNSQENLNFQQLIEFLNNKNLTTTLDLKKNILHNNASFFYEGSFTTPPCLEAAKWFVFKNPILLSQNQINSIIKNTIFVSNNARPLQKFEPQKF